MADLTLFLSFACWRFAAIPVTTLESNADRSPLGHVGDPVGSHFYALFKLLKFFQHLLKICGDNFSLKRQLDQTVA